MTSVPDHLPVAPQVDWLLGVLRGPETLADADLEEIFTPTFLSAVRPEEVVAALTRHARELGSPEIDAVVTAAAHRVVIEVAGNTGNRRRISIAVNSDAPRLIAGLAFAPLRPRPPKPGEVPRHEIPDRIEELLSRITDDTPGAVVGVFRAGEIEYANGFGLANLDHRVRNSPSTMFRIGSTTKQFTALAVAMLVADRQLNIDDAVVDVVPELRKWPEIRIRHLVHHTSGLCDFRQLRAMAGRGRRAPDSLAAVLGMLERQAGLNFPPGTSFLYSNSNYAVLAAVIEHVSGTTLREFARARIFEPLGMSSTRFHDNAWDVVPHRATGYVQSPTGDWTIAEDFLMEVVGHANLMTSIEELARWDAAVSHHPDNLSGALAIAEQHGELDDGTPISYGWGVMHGTYRGEAVMAHSGASEGFRADILRFPAVPLTVACLTNCMSVTPTEICLSVADLYLAEHLSPEPVALRFSQAGAFNHADASTDRNPASAHDDIEVDGTYWCSELGISYVIRTDEHGATIVTPQGSGPLVKQSGRRFTSPLAGGLAVTVVETSRRKADRLLVGGARVFGLEFNRQEPSRWRRSRRR